MLPRPLHDAASALDGLPGIGPRAALRYAYWLAGQPREAVLKFARAIESLASNVKACDTCGAWSDADGCPICLDPKREDGSLCVVATSQDIRVIDESGAFHGKFHVLGGLLDPIEGRTPETLNIRKLLLRLQRPDNKITEIILALDPDVAGDTTAMYLIKQLTYGRSAGTPLPGAPSPLHDLTITRLARGLQNGAQIEYADGVTIADALKNRR